MREIVGSDLAGWLQVALEAMAILLVVLFYVFDYRRGKAIAEEEKSKERQRKSNLKKAILSALKRELEMNWRYVHNSPSSQVYHAQYYNPTHQTFKVCRDDAIMWTLGQVETDILLDYDLAQSLLAVSQSVRFVNQQIDELMAFRFGDPNKLARASRYVRDNPQSLQEFVLDETKIPAAHRPWFKELALRNWAIVNEGYWYRLLPTLVVVRPYLDKALEEMGLEPLEMPNLEKVLGMLASAATEAAMASGSPSVGFEEVVGRIIEESKEENHMTYHVYENWTVHKAKIHLSDCSFCNNGKGIHPDAGTSNGRWLGPFATLDAALRAAQATGEPISKCKFCRPQ